MSWAPARTVTFRPILGASSGPVAGDGVIVASAETSLSPGPGRPALPVRAAGRRRLNEHPAWSCATSGAAEKALLPDLPGIGVRERDANTTSLGTMKFSTSLALPSRRARSGWPLRRAGRMRGRPDRGARPEPRKQASQTLGELLLKLSSAKELKFSRRRRRTGILEADSVAVERIVDGEVSSRGSASGTLRRARGRSRAVEQARNSRGRRVDEGSRAQKPQTVSSRKMS